MTVEDKNVVKHRMTNNDYNYNMNSNKYYNKEYDCETNYNCSNKVDVNTNEKDKHNSTHYNDNNIF